MPDTGNNLAVYLQESAPDYWRMLSAAARQQAGTVDINWTAPGSRPLYNTALNRIDIPRDAPPSAWMHEATHALQTTTLENVPSPFGSEFLRRRLGQTATSWWLRQRDLEPALAESYGIAQDTPDRKMIWDVFASGAEQLPMALHTAGYRPWKVPEEERGLYSGMFNPMFMNPPETWRNQEEGAYGFSQGFVDYGLSGAPPAAPLSPISGPSPFIMPEETKVQLPPPRSDVRGGRGTPPPYIRPTPPPRPPRTRPKPRRR